MIRYIFAGMIFYAMFRLTWSYVMNMSTIHMIKNYCKTFHYVTLYNNRESFVTKLIETANNLSEENPIFKSISEKFKSGVDFNKEELAATEIVLRQEMEEVIATKILPKANIQLIYNRIFNMPDDYNSDIFDHISILIRGAFMASTDYGNICNEEYYNELKKFVVDNRSIISLMKEN